MNELALFAGAGGILGGKLLGWRTVCAVEWDGYARDVLVARQNDGCLSPFPIWDDVQTFDGKPWRGRVDVISGGFPCQDISSAGKGAGIDGERSGMWSHMARIIGEVRPSYVFVENSPLLVGRGLARVLGDFAKMGYDARWGVLGAHHVGAPHKRDRIWIMADASSKGREGVEQSRALRDERNGEEAHGSVAECGGISRSEVGDTDCLDGRTGAGREDGEETCHAGWWAIEPKLGRVAYDVANRVHRLRCIGNGQVPAVAALAWNTLTDNRDHTADTNNE